MEMFLLEDVMMEFVKGSVAWAPMLLKLEEALERFWGGFAEEERALRYEYVCIPGMRMSNNLTRAS